MSSSLPHASLGPRFVAAFAIATAACSASTPEPPGERKTPVVAAAATEFNTFIGASTYLQIDQVDVTTDLLKGDDANLFLGDDPADTSPSRDFPLCTSCTAWTDWTLLQKENHQLLDVDRADGKDPTAFPRSDSCVGVANVVSKMDLGYVGVASNNQYVYLDVMRRSNLGDAGYVWLFTKLAPPFEANAACRAEEKLLQFNVSEGDVMVFGHYKTGGGPLLRVFKAKAAGLYDAVGAINFDNAALWQEAPAGTIAAVAVNTTITDPGTWGLAGAIKPVKGMLDTELFAEAAITTKTFTGEASACGHSYYAAVITRSSGSGGTSPDVKDVAGPAKFNFGSVKVTPTATPDCDGKITLDATVLANGEPTTTAGCEWREVTAGGESVVGSTCKLELTGNTGTRTFKVHVSTADGCSADSATVTAAAWPRPVATADLTGTCESTMKYEGGATGVQGTAEYAWAFSDGGSSTTLAGSFAVKPDLKYSGTLVVTDTRPDGKGGTLVCASLPAKDEALARAPISLGLGASANPLTCSATAPNEPIGDAVTFTATVGGGDKAYVYQWKVDGVVAACTTATCTIDPAPETTCARHEIAVTVDDGDPLCAAQTAGPMTYQKVTTVTVQTK